MNCFFLHWNLLSLSWRRLARAKTFTVGSLHFKFKLWLKKEISHISQHGNLFTKSHKSIWLVYSLKAANRKTKGHTFTFGTVALVTVFTAALFQSLVIQAACLSVTGDFLGSTGATITLLTLS